VRVHVHTHTHTHTTHTHTHTPSLSLTHTHMQVTCGRYKPPKNSSVKSAQWFVSRLLFDIYIYIYIYIYITFGSVLNNKLEVNGNINIPTGSTFKINNVNFGYSNLDHKLLAGTNINIDNDYKINSTYTYQLPTAGIGTAGALGGVKVDNTTITINNGVISGANTYTLPTASTSVLGGVRVDGSTININNGVISATAGAAQVNSDWTQTNTSLKSFIQNKPTAGTNISFQGNTITNTIIGSPTQNIIDLNTNHLIIKDKPNSVKEDFVDIPLTSGNEPTITSPY
jgi:hypothetical protein